MRERPGGGARAGAGDRRGVSDSTLVDSASRRGAVAVAVGGGRGAGRGGRGAGGRTDLVSRRGLGRLNFRRHGAFFAVFQADFFRRVFPLVHRQHLRRDGLLRRFLLVLCDERRHALLKVPRREVVFVRDLVEGIGVPGCEHSAPTRRISRRSNPYHVKSPGRSRGFRCLEVSIQHPIQTGQPGRPTHVPANARRGSKVGVPGHGTIVWRPGGPACVCVCVPGCETPFPRTAHFQAGQGRTWPRPSAKTGWCAWM